MASAVLPAAALSLRGTSVPTSISWLTRTVITIGFSLCTFLVGLRMYVRITIHRAVWWDDWLAVTSLLLLNGHCFLSAVTIPYADGMKTGDTAVMWNLYVAMEFVGIAAELITRASLLLLYLRFLCTEQGMKAARLSFATWIFASVNAMASVLTMLYLALQCTQTSYEDSRTCAGKTGALSAAEATDIALNALTLLIAVAGISHLTMIKHRLVSVSLVIAVALTTTASISRIVYLNTLRLEPDTTLIESIVSVLTAVEIAAGIAAASLPVAAKVGSGPLRGPTTVPGGPRLPPRDGVAFSFAALPSNIPSPWAVGYRRVSADSSFGHQRRRRRVARWRCPWLRSPKVDDDADVPEVFRDRRMRTVGGEKLVDADDYAMRALASEVIRQGEEKGNTPWVGFGRSLARVSSGPPPQPEQMEALGNGVIVQTFLVEITAEARDGW